MTRLLTFVLALFIGFTTFAQSLTYSSDSSDIKLTGVVELGYLNGSDNEVVGAILDASLRVGMEFEQPITAFLNFRYLGGGAVGTTDIDGPGDGYVRNWLNFLTLTAGFRYELAW